MTEFIKSQMVSKSLLDEDEKYSPKIGFKIPLNEHISTYKRFYIEISIQPGKNNVPFPFYPIVKKTGLLKLLLHEILSYNFKLLKKKYRKRLFARPCIYGVFSGKLGGFRPIREKCVGCLRCVQEYPEFCTVERNKEFLDFSDSYWVPDSTGKLANMATPFSIVWYEAETGKILVKGMGYKGSFSDVGWDSIWTDMSEIVRPTRDGVYGREYISTAVNIGKKPLFLSKTKEQTELNTIKTLQLPIIFDYLPDNFTGKEVTESIYKAAENTSTLAIFSTEQVKKYLSNFNEKENFGIYLKKNNETQQIDIIKKAKIVEIDYSCNIDPLIVKKINPKAPILYRLPFKDNMIDVLLKLNMETIDGFHLYADYHGKTFSKKNEDFIINPLRTLHCKLVEEGLRNKITLIVSGGIILAEHVPKAIICGADLVAINTSIHIALQSKIIGESKFPEKSFFKTEKISTEWGSQRLTNLLGSWHYQLIEILSAMGIRDVRRLRGETGRAIFKSDIEDEAFSDIEGYLEQKI